MGLHKHRTLNLVKHRKKRTDPAPILFALLALAGMLVLTAVLQHRVHSAEETLADAAVQLETAAAENADYRSLTAEYERLTAAQIRESALVDRLEVLSLVSRRVFPAATVRSLRLNGNTAVLQLSGVSLDRAGDLLDELREEPFISDLSLSNVGGEAGTVTVTAYLRREEAAP